MTVLIRGSAIAAIPRVTSAARVLRVATTPMERQRDDEAGNHEAYRWRGELWHVLRGRRQPRLFWRVRDRQQLEVSTEYRAGGATENWLIIRQDPSNGTVMIKIIVENSGARTAGAASRQRRTT